MRIISGIYKGRRINPPANLPVRPTTDMAKEALFNILGNNFYFDEISILDLFSGTGNISYEFASRGCENLIAVDIDSKCVRFTEDIKSKLEITGLRIIRANVFQYLKNQKQKFDIIFADPPYDLKEYDKIPELVFNNELLNQNGCLIIEHPISVSFTKYEHFKEIRKYGKVNFSFFELRSSNI